MVLVRAPAAGCGSHTVVAGGRAGGVSRTARLTRTGCRGIIAAFGVLASANFILECAHGDARILFVATRRGALASAAAAGLLGASPALAFKASELGGGLQTGLSGSGLGGGLTKALPGVGQKELREALVLIGRVQEATVQEERLVSSGKFKDVQRNSIRMAFTMMLENYKLEDNIVKACNSIQPATKIIEAKGYADQAVESIYTANEYFAKKLSVSTLTDQQRSFVLAALKDIREKLDTFLKYVPKEEVDKARKQIEEENAMNMQEFQGEGGAIINPVTLPWKTSQKTVPG